MRSVENGGDFATIVRKGDPDRGALLLLIESRGCHSACIGRVLSPVGDYHWQRMGPEPGADSAEVRAFLQKAVRFDEDMWVIELDVADPERFVEEIGLTG